MWLVGKAGEQLLHEVAARYVEGMKHMAGRTPGPSSALGDAKFKTVSRLFVYLFSALQEVRRLTSGLAPLKESPS